LLSFPNLRIVAFSVRFGVGLLHRGVDVPRLGSKGRFFAYILGNIFYGEHPCKFPVG
jgi:hypothetical protein